MSNFTQDRIDQVWDKGEVIHGKNPDLYRMDKFGNVMYKHSYGKYTPMGWNIDHSKPQSKGGTDHLNNLQPMNSRANCRKNDEYWFQLETMLEGDPHGHPLFYISNTSPPHAPQTVHACSILVCFEIVYKTRKPYLHTQEMTKGFRS